MVDRGRCAGSQPWESGLVSLDLWILTACEIRDTTSRAMRTMEMAQEQCAIATINSVKRASLESLKSMNWNPTYLRQVCAL
jgi:hypothetical protein